jgi:hypothetical protein
MNQKAQVILLQIVKLLKDDRWTTDSQWQLSLKADGYVPLVRPIIVEGRLDDTKWKDQIHTLIRVKVSTDDDITFFPEVSIYAQIAIGEVPAKDIEYDIMGNTAFTDKDLKDSKKLSSASKEITRMVDNHINEVYQDYVDTNEELIMFYKQASSQNNSEQPPTGA